MSFKLDAGAVNRVSSTHFSEGAFFADVVTGLSAHPRTLPCKYFYDERGSRLFEEICLTPEYYPTRTEVHILRTHGPAIAGHIGPHAHLVELGSGPSTKIRILLDALPELSSYVPVDISGLYLMRTACAVARDYPDLHVAPVCADFTAAFQLPRKPPAGRVVGFFPGSTIGNFAPFDARQLLRRFARTLGSGSGLLIGVDLKKNPAILNAAYNDAAGITAAFNLNLLKRINRELSGDFDLDAFAHRAFYNAAEGRVEMHLESLRHQTVRIESHEFNFVKGETIHTESSYKYSVPEFKALAADAGYACRAVWTDSKELFSVHYMTLDN